MKLEVDGKAAFAYTANHDLDPKKRTVVFIHGAGLDHSWFGLQSRYFGYHGYNVLALDLPGHGKSAGPVLTTVPAMTDWVVQLLDNLKISKASFVGHSMGTLISGWRKLTGSDEPAMKGTFIWRARSELLEWMMTGQMMGCETRNFATSRPSPGSRPGEAASRS